MPEKKRQHYVPKFLLKQFSNNGNDKQINIYNITNDAIINSASLKEQAAESYFYGKDKVIEDSFGKVETEAAKVFKEIIEGKLPPQNTSKHSVILYFTLTLGARTLYKADEQVELINKLMKKIASLDPKLKDHLDDFKIKVENPLSMTLKAFATSLSLAVDLKYKLLVNKTKTPVIILLFFPFTIHNSPFTIHYLVFSPRKVSTRGRPVFHGVQDDSRKNSMKA